MEVRPGYKETEIGPLPEDWSCERVRDAAANRANAIVGGPFGSDLVSADYVPHGVPVIRGQNMAGGTVAGDFVFVLPEKAKKLRANLAHGGDLVFTQRGTLGQVSLVPAEAFEAYLVSQSQMKVSLNRERHDPGFLRQYFASQFGQKQILDSAIQTGVPHTNLGILRNYCFPAPLLSEQQEIAAALSDVDALLGGLDRLIAKKRDLKQAAMQQLLTGQTRLPGFHGEWEVKRLGEVAEIVMGQSPSSSNYNSTGHGLPLIQGNADIADRKAIRRFFTTQITKRGRAGDILMSVRAPVGEVSRTTFDVCLGRGVCAIRFPNDLLYHCLILLEPSWAKHSKGSTFDSVDSTDIRALEIKLPTDSLEQIAIGAVLSDMDAELAALGARRDKTRALKQAMMQELLTGKTRLVPAGGAHA